ncbi:MAG: leucine-rich repeat domain-containing protein, partial [Bacteroidaceae bacterium]|nr:leucine-rich repeat domain-containing protein [Bacteroidaceae bacterium]
CITVSKDNPVYDSRDNCNALIETATNTIIRGCENTVIPNSVTTIGKGAFRRCSALTNVTIPNSVTSIGDYAFYFCDALTGITIPNSVTCIGEAAFSNCSALTSITVSKDNPVYDSRDNCNAIIETATNTIILGCKNTVVPDGVKW